VRAGAAAWEIAARRCAIVPSQAGKNGKWIREINLSERAAGEAEPIAHEPVSTILEGLRDSAPPDRFSLDWLLDCLRDRSFAVVILMLAVVSMAPVVSTVTGLLTIGLGIQMILGRASPAFPRRLGAYQVPTVYLSGTVRRIVPVLRQIEKIIRPRWQPPPQTTKRAVGFIVVLLSIAVVFVPIPLSNVAPAFVIALIAMAYLEDDGLFLSLALAAGLTLLLIAAFAIWEAIVGVQWISGVL
jgi:hypothetical protein